MTRVFKLSNFSISLGTITCLAAAGLTAPIAQAQNATTIQLQDIGASERINAAGKLRMLSQRVVAAACYVQADISTEATTEMLIATSDEFRQILVALEFGDATLGMQGAETDIKTLATIERLHAIWDPIEATVEHVLSQSATPDEITQMAIQSEPLLEMAKTLVSAVTEEYSLGAEL